MLYLWSRVHVSFLVLKLSLTLKETSLGSDALALGLKVVFIPKAKAVGCCMELALGTAISAVAAWFIAYIWQPDEPSFCKHSNFPGIGIHLHCLGP